MATTGMSSQTVIGSCPPGHNEPDIHPLPRLRATADAPPEHSFFETKNFPQSSLDNYSDLGPSPFSHPYLYSVAWGHKVIRFFYVMDFPKDGMCTPILGRTYWLGTQVHEDKSENVEIQRKDMISGFLDCEDPEYDGILAALKAGIYVRATVYSMKMMRSGSTSSRVIMGVVYCAIVDSDSDSELELCPADCQD